MSTSHTTLKAVEKAIPQFLDGTQIFNPRFFYKIYEGYSFVVSHRFESVASDAAVIPEGFNFLVKVTNKSAAAADLSIRILWWEEP